jgi:hypothetical protein
MNGGKCIDGIQSYECECAAGFKGENCDVNIDECASNPCMNDGKCVDGINGFTCICYTTHAGDLCELEVDSTTTETSHSHHHHHHHGHIFVNCNGGQWGLQWLLKAKAHSSWLKKLFEKKNNGEWLSNLLEKKEIDSDQHTFLKDLLAKRDQEESSDDTNQWWKNLSEKKYDGHVPYWAKDGEAQNVNMNWKWSASHSHSHTTSHSKTTTTRHTRKFGHDDSESSSQESASDASASESSESEPMGGLVSQQFNSVVSHGKHFKSMVARGSNLRGGRNEESSSESSDVLLI